jgi:CheY-like chemotaxis protein
MSKQRILCVDDNKDSSEVITLMLQDSGFDTVAAGSCAEALQLLQEQKCDLILLDLRLPDGDGVELCNGIRKIDPRIPIVFFSASATKAEMERAMQNGAQAYLTKPKGLDVLTETISQLLEETGT